MAYSAPSPIASTASTSRSGHASLPALAMAKVSGTPYSTYSSRLTVAATWLPVTACQVAISMPPAHSSIASAAKSHSRSGRGVRRARHMQLIAATSGASTRNG